MASVCQDLSRVWKPIPGEADGGAISQFYLWGQPPMVGLRRSLGCFEFALALGVALVRLANHLSRTVRRWRAPNLCAVSALRIGRRHVCAGLVSAQAPPPARPPRAQVNSLAPADCNGGPITQTRSQFCARTMAAVLHFVLFLPVRLTCCSSAANFAEVRAVGELHRGSIQSWSQTLAARGA